MYSCSVDMWHPCPGCSVEVRSVPRPTLGDATEAFNFLIRFQHIIASDGNYERTASLKGIHTRNFCWSKLSIRLE